MYAFVSYAIFSSDYLSLRKLSVNKDRLVLSGNQGSALRPRSHGIQVQIRNFWNWDCDRFFKILGLGLRIILLNLGLGLGFLSRPLVDYIFD